jgi:hypothetical protein
MADQTPPNYATPVGQVRLNIRDTETPYVFSDTQIETLLVQASDSILRASEFGLLSIAADMILTLKWWKTDDAQVDGQKVSSELRALAKAYADRADAEDAAANEFFYVTYPNDLDLWPELLPRPVFGWR